MNGKKLALNVMWLVVTFTLLTIVILDVLSNIDNFLYDESIVIIMHGVGCVVIGMELKDYISRYWFYKYCQEEEMK